MKMMGDPLGNRPSGFGSLNFGGFAFTSVPSDFVLYALLEVDF